MRNPWSQSVVILAVVAVAAVLTGWLHPRAPAWAPTGEGERSPLAIAWESVAALRDDEVLWVDARSAAEFAGEHAPGAVNLNEDDWNAGFDEFIMRWNPDSTVVVYCDATGCHASEAVAQRLRRELGSDRIFFLEGGWQEWQAHN